MGGLLDVGVRGTGSFFNRRLRVSPPCSFSVFLLRVPSPCSFSVFLLRTIAPLWFLLDLLDDPRVLIVVSITWPVIVRISDFAQQETSPLVTGPAEYKLVGESISLLHHNNRPSYQDRYGWSFQHRTGQTLGSWWYRKKFPSGFQTANTPIAAAAYIDYEWIRRREAYAGR